MSRPQPKVMNIGLMKCGTCTLHQAFIMSGFKSIHFTQGVVSIARLIYGAYGKGLDPLHNINAECITQPDYCFNGVSLWPQCDLKLLDRIRENYPELLFILNSRDPNEHANSLYNWHSMPERLNKGGAPGLETPVNIERIKDWIVAHNNKIRDYFQKDKHFIEIEIDKSDAKSKLEKALDIEIKWWGRANPSGFRKKLSKHHDRPVNDEIEDRDGA